MDNLRIREAESMIMKLKRKGNDSFADRLSKAVESYKNGRMPYYVFDDFVMDAYTVLERIKLNG